MLMGSLSFDEEQTKSILQEWLKIVKGDNPIIDIRGYSFIDPLYVAMLITLKKGVRDDIEIMVDVDSPAYSYIQYILGWQGRSASTVVPIRIVDRQLHVNRFVDELLKSTNLSFDDWEDEDAFRYIIRELIDNALEHGGSPAIACAQVFRNLGEVEIVVSDYGYGFLQTIARNHKVSTYEEAIKKALERKVSGSLQNMYGSSTKHAGMGLYVMSNIIKETEGKMFIISGYALVSLSGRQLTSYKMQEEWKGSVVAMRFKLDKFKDRVLNYGFTNWLNYKVFTEDTSEEDVF
jgi:anti-sigma regulatory factor (Ser/Thr protein kinase)